MFNETIENKKVKSIILNYFNNYSIGKVKENNVLAIPNEKSKLRKYSFFIQENNTWREEKKSLSALIKKLIEKYKVDNWKSKWLIDGKEKTIHFYDSFRDRVVSKFKELGDKTKSSGKQCSIGQSKLSISKKLESLENILRVKLNKPAKKDITSTKDMCIAIMLYSYILTYKYNEKYNFNLLENYLYDVSLLPKLDKEKLDKDGKTLFLV